MKRSARVAFGGAVHHANQLCLQQLAGPRDDAVAM